MSVLQVLVEDANVGVLDEPTDGGLRFAYAEAWLEAPRRFAISRSLPLRRLPFEQEADRWFGNLLPEGAVRAAICRRLRISEDNDFALLRAIGRECAGALSLVEGDAIEARANAYRPLGDDEIEKWASTGAYAAAVGDDLRLSLAGAQDKLGVWVDGETLSLPEHGAPSTHLLKLPNRDFAALPQNEALVLELARRVGLPTVESRLLTKLSTPVLLVTRFDRVRAPVLRRLHQEDFCQALAIDRHRKHEAEGGPRFAQCLELVREASVQPLPDTRALLRWLAFCSVVGNRDNHGKNLSLVRDDRGHWRLAPFYDLVCTTAYPRLSRRLAMHVGGRHDGGNLPAGAWEDEARTIGIKAKYLLDTVEEIAAGVDDALPEVVDSIAAQLGRDDGIVAVRRAILAAVRSARRGLRSR